MGEWPVFFLKRVKRYFFRYPELVGHDRGAEGGIGVIFLEVLHQPAALVVLNIGGLLLRYGIGYGPGCIGQCQQRFGWVAPEAGKPRKGRNLALGSRFPGGEEDLGL